MPKRTTPTLDKAEAEFTRVCAEISRVEKRLAALRTRAEKFSHYIEIARQGTARPPRKRKPRERRSVPANDEP